MDVIYQAIKMAVIAYSQIKQTWKSKLIQSRQNLLEENKDEKTIFIIENTMIDVLITVKGTYNHDV